MRLGIGLLLAVLCLSAGWVGAGAVLAASLPESPAAVAPSSSAPPAGERREAPPAATAVQGVVEAVTVELKLQSPHPLYPDLAERIQLAVQTVGEKILLGQKISLLQSLAPQVEGVVTRVFAQVLPGFKIVGTQIRPGPTTHLVLTLAVTGPVIEGVEVKVSVEGVDPRLNALLEANTPLFSELGERILVGLPLTVSWAKGIVELALEQVVAAQLPGFGVELQLELERVTRLTLRLRPKGERVTAVTVALRSQSLPRLWLQRYQQQADEAGRMLIGLPTRFLHKYKGQVAAEVARALNQQPAFRRFGLGATLDLAPGEITTVTLAVESRLWRLHLDGVLNIGAAAPPPELTAGLGVMLGPRQEFFVIDSLRLTELTQTLQAGLGIEVSPGTSVGGICGVGETWELWFAHAAGEVTLNIQANVWRGEGLVAVGTPLNDNTRLELVANHERRYWVRLVAHI